MQIRRAGRDDAELLARLVEPVHTLHVEAHPDFFKPYAFTPELVGDYRERLADPSCYIFIAEADGEAVGYVAAEVLERPDNPYTYAMRFILVDQISVSPAWRSQGYGEALMRRVSELARSLGIGRVSLNVWGFNPRAIAFYERLGFRTRDLRMETIIEV
jgi:ribosomal protein S18 acetylase RimI-like enzyme